MSALASAKTKTVTEFDQHNIGSIYKAIEHHHATIEFDLNGVVVNANTNFLSLFGYVLDDLLGKHHDQLCVAGNAENEENIILWQKLRAGESVSAEFHRIAADGRDVYIQACYIPVLDNVGKPCKIIQISSDITASKVKCLEDDGKIMAINRTQAEIEFDLDGIVLTANQKFLEIFGYTLQEIIGQHQRIFCSEAYAESENYQDFWKELRAGEPQQGEFLQVNRQGRSVWLQATYTPVMNTAGEIYKIIQFASDITGTKLAALANEGKISAISRSQGVVEFDLVGNILDANENFLELTGYTLEEIKGEHHRLFVDKEEASGGAYRAFWQKLGNGQFDSGEYLRFGKHGKKIWIQTTYNPILDLDGKPIRVVKYCNDITSAKLAATEMAARMEALSKSSCLMELSADGHMVLPIWWVNMRITFNSKKIFAPKLTSIYGARCGSIIPSTSRCGAKKPNFVLIIAVIISIIRFSNYYV